MTAQQFATILGLVESDGNIAAWGDAAHGAYLAVGRFQVHPAWLFDHILKPAVSETWDSWVERMVEAFYTPRAYLPPVEVAMWFHIGHRVQPDENDWDAPYAKRFADKQHSIGL